MEIQKLLTRIEFREQVFERDHKKCVVPSCNNDAVDAHHIIERRLWTKDWNKEGYFLSNGASLCEVHHKLAERNKIAPQTLRQWCDIKSTVLPINLADDNIINYEYSKWGDKLKDPERVSIKYPSTFYLPFSPRPKEHEKDLGDMKELISVPCVETIKMDGSNVKITSEKVTARNGYDATHKSFDMLKSIFKKFQHLIPSNIEIFGEWLYAEHSIHYVKNLALNNYLNIFAVYDKSTAMFLGWDDVE